MRAIWSGAISFGLVNIPVNLYSASAGTKLGFHLLHRTDLSPIRFARMCNYEKRVVPNDEIVKGYEWEKGQFVVMADEDFKRANVRKTKTIDIVSFVRQDEVDCTYYDKPYYLEPEKSGHKAYAILREALTKAKKVGIAKSVLRDREHLFVLKPQEDVLVLNQLRYASEVTPVAGLNLPSAELAQDREMEIALAIIEQLTETFDLTVFKDTYTEELERVIAEKAQGRVPAQVGEEPQPTEVEDLMAVLKASLERAKAKTAA